MSVYHWYLCACVCVFTAVKSHLFFFLTDKHFVVLGRLLVLGCSCTLARRCYTEPWTWDDLPVSLNTHSKWRTFGGRHIRKHTHTQTYAHRHMHTHTMSPVMFPIDRCSVLLTLMCHYMRKVAHLHPWTHQKTITNSSHNTHTYTRIHDTSVHHFRGYHLHLKRMKELHYKDPFHVLKVSLDMQFLFVCCPSLICQVS